MILITGGVGFIGLHAARAILDAGEEVVLTRCRAWRLPDFPQDEVGRRLHVLYAEPVDLLPGLPLLDVLRKYDCPAPSTWPDRPNRCPRSKKPVGHGRRPCLAWACPWC